MSAIVPASGSQTALLTINSIDRYASVEASRDPANWTTPSDVTYTIPGLEKAKSIQVAYWFAQDAPFSGLGTPGNNANVIDVIYNGVKKQVVIPFDISYTPNSGYYLNMQRLLQTTFQDTTIAFGLAFNNPLGGFQTYTTAPTNTLSVCYTTWYSTTATLGFSRVSTYNGVDITNQRQLFDLLGLKYQMIAGVPTSQISGVGQWAMGVYPGLTSSAAPSRPSPFIQLQSPNLSPLYPSIGSPPNMSKYGPTLFRMNTNNYFGPGSMSSGTVVRSLTSFKTDGTNKLRLVWTDDSGNAFQPKAPIPQVFKYTAISCSYTNGVITVPSTPNSLLNSGWIIGDKIAITSASQLTCGVWSITNITSSNVTVNCPVIQTGLSCSIGGPYIEGGNTVGFGGNSEYIVGFMIDYGDGNVPVTSQAILS